MSKVIIIVMSRHAMSTYMSYTKYNITCHYLNAMVASWFKCKTNPTHPNQGNLVHQLQRKGDKYKSLLMSLKEQTLQKHAKKQLINIDLLGIKTNYALKSLP